MHVEPAHAGQSAVEGKIPRRWISDGLAFSPVIAWSLPGGHASRAFWTMHHDTAERGATTLGRIIPS